MRSASGVVDLLSIVVGVIIAGILAAVLVPITFQIIPWAQDLAARQSLGVVRVAQGTSMARRGNYADLAGLAGDQLIHGGLHDVAVAIEPGGYCWGAVARSASGAFFWSGSGSVHPAPYTVGEVTDSCVDLDALVAAR